MNEMNKWFQFLNAKKPFQKYLEKLCHISGMAISNFQSTARVWVSEWVQVY